LRVEQMILVEPVAIRPRNVVGLVRSVRAEDGVVDLYLDRNSAFHDAVSPAVNRGESLPHQSRTDLAHFGYALSRGRMTRDLLRACIIQDFSVQLVHGAESTLSRAADVGRLAAKCRRAGIDVRDVPVAGRHALWHSLPDVEALARFTLNAWPT
jgi:hypothetical protein